MKILSIAYDREIKNVKNYVHEKNMDWARAFHKNDDRTVIIRDLKIVKYPTLILIDKNRKILHRGVGKKALIEKIIKN